MVKSSARLSPWPLSSDWNLEIEPLALSQGTLRLALPFLPGLWQMVKMKIVLDKE